MKLEKAIELLVGKDGAQWQLGKVLGCSQAAVAQWNPEKIPWARELQVNDLVRKQKEKKAKAKSRKSAKNSAMKVGDKVKIKGLKHTFIIKDEA
jgi:hypothetical protein